MEARGPWLRRWLGVLAILAVLVAVALVGALAPHGRREVTSFLTADEVLDNRTALYGKSVRVRDRVARVVGATVVTLGAGATGEEILVFGVAATPSLDDVADDDRTPVGDVVAAEGQLLRFEIGELEARVGELDESRYQRFEGTPALIARSWTPAPATG
ncbi:MAG: hypothetical protein M3N68_14460 [Actinomycetota bacterium]|nr:hypothetical protein [Actinomycetota bacterium]